MIKRITLLAVMALILSTFPIMTVGATGDHPALTPADVDAVLFPGQSIDVVKTVHTPEFPPMLDVYFLADTTGSMGPVLTNVKNNAASILATVAGGTADVRFGAGDYKDFPFDSYAFDNGAPIPAADDAGAAALAEIASWSPSGGADGSEGQFFALDRLAKDIDPAGGTIGWRAGSTPVVVWFGDAPAHDPVCAGISGLGFDITEASVTSALITAGVRVIAVNTPTGFYPLALDDNPTTSAGDYSGTCGVTNGLSGQATRIGPATGGAVLTAATPDEVASTILAGLSNLLVEVSMTSNCADPISTTFAPATQTVVSGEDAVFTETIAVSGGEGDYTCEDWALINGEPMTDEAGAIIYETKTIHVPVHFLTGGGQTDKGKKALNFGGNVGWLADGTIVGQWQFRDGGEKLMMHSLSIDTLVFSNDAGADPDPPAADYEVATFSGTSRVKLGTAQWDYDCTFTAQAHDHGEPNVADVFGIQIKCGADTWTYGRLVLDTGNFQIHSGLKG